MYNNGTFLNLCHDWASFKEYLHRVNDEVQCRMSILNSN